MLGNHLLIQIFLELIKVVQTTYTVQKIVLRYSFSAPVIKIVERKLVRDSTPLNGYLYNTNKRELKLNENKLTK